MASLPFELWDTIAGISDARTKLRLLFVSRQIQKFTEPSFLKNVKLNVRDLRRQNSPLISFHKCMTGDTDRPTFVKSFAIVFPNKAPSTQDIELIDELIPSFPHLISLSFDFCYYEPRIHGHITCLHSESTKARRIIGRLTRFSLTAVHGSHIDLTRFLSSQPHLEHLELSDYSCTIKGTLPVFNSLRSFEGNITHLIGAGALNPISVECLRLGPDPHSVYALPDMNSLHTLSCLYFPSQDAYFKRTLFCAPNLRCLEIYTSTRWIDLSKITNTAIMYIRFATDTPWSITQAHRVFNAPETPPSLYCIEFPKQENYSPFALRNPSMRTKHYATRYYRDLAEPVVVEWECKVEDIWWHDWERDVRIEAWAP
ncbi:hypothetical protein ONZ45_g12188 [Pleurotus djamor]|nr:hypothetical protein ONZ45_g12188 [Pleurotus djamor]